MQRKGSLPGKIFARCIPERRFAGLFGCMARISCQSQLVLDAWRVNLAREGRFSRPGPLRGCMERKNCHGLPPENASRRNPAIVRHPRAHSVAILPRCLPKRGVSLVRGCRLRGGIGAGPSAADAYGLPGAGRHWCGLSAAGRGIGTRGPPGRGVGSGISPFRGSIARNGFESALFRWATMGPLRVLRSSAVSCAEAKCALTFMLGAANVVKGMSWAFARQWEIWQAR